MVPRARSQSEENVSENLTWYSGSDATGQTAAEIQKIIQAQDELTAEQRLSRLGGLLEEENDANWRAFILHLMGLEHYLNSEYQEAVTRFLEADR